MASSAYWYCVSSYQIRITVGRKTYASAREAMARRSSNTLRLREPLRVVIAYNTVGVAPDGRVLFHPDIYGHDAALDAALRRGARAAAP